MPQKTFGVFKVFYTFAPIFSRELMMNELQLRIIEQATPMFLHYGIKAVTMDMIAARLGMSKRTLYENFKEKNELLLACLEKAEDDRNMRLKNYYAQRQNVIELLLNVHEDILRFMRNASPAYFIDMERYYPKVYDRYEREKEIHKRAIVDLLREGIGEGMIRDDINLEIVGTLLSLQFELLKNSDQIFKSKYTFTEIFETIFKSFIRGIATPEGVCYTNEFFAGRENK